MKKRSLTLLVEGHLDNLKAKTAVGILRYCPDEVSCVLDSTREGQSLFSLLGVGQGIRIVGSVDQALSLGPTGILIGIAPAGGQFPASWRSIIMEYIKRGLDIISGMHQFLADDEEFGVAAKLFNARIVDLRRPPRRQIVACGRALGHAGLRVLTVGTDECLGKMTTALQITGEATSRGWNTKFLATGQTGIAIAGEGVAVDAVVADFLAGSVESMVLENSEHDLLVIEGQGSIFSPSFSGVSLSLLHGSMPQALILCHDPARTQIRGTAFPLPSLQALRDTYEKLAENLFPCISLAVCLNTSSFSEEEAQKIIADTESTLGVVTTDPVRYGVKRVVDALELMAGRAKV